MTIDSALFYLYEKVKNDPKSTESEIEAINHMIKWVNDFKKESLNSHKLFSKLYIIYYGILLENFKDKESSQFQINQDLSKSVDFHIEILRLKVNNLEFKKFALKNGVSLKKYYEMTKEELIIDDQKGKNILSSVRSFDSEQVDKNIKIQITESINAFNHYD